MVDALRRGRFHADDVLGPTALLILQEISRRRIPPTIRQLAKKLGMQINAINSHLRRLQRLGFVHKENWLSRTLVLTCEFIPADKLGEADADLCCVCNKPAVRDYADREDCPSCGRPECDRAIQAGIDYHDEVGCR